MANELVGLAEVAADAVDRLVVTPVQTMHTAIARRAFGNTPGSAPARLIHDGIATAVYSGMRGAARGAAGLAAAAARGSASGELRPLSRSPHGRFFVGALNGVTGDRLEETGNDLAIGMAVRVRGDDVACSAEELRRAFAGATPRAVVFLHGLAETEEWWLRRRSDAEGHRMRPFGERLRADAGLTAVYVRYNTGRHVSENGWSLASLLERLVAAWPVPLEELVLVGHSMGGLVIRSACHLGAESGHAWPQRVRDVVTLGAPHHGAPLAKAIHTAAWALRRLPESTPLADILDLRSNGIRDMRFGAAHDEDWRDEDRRALLGDTRRHLPLMPHARYTFITATLTRDPQHLLGRVAGDLLVRRESAGGHCRQHTVQLEPGSVVHLNGLTHFDLLDHPAVYEVLRGALASTQDAAAGRPRRRVSAGTAAATR